MLERFTVQISTSERQALQQMAENEMRDFRAQARLLIRLELERNGYLKDENVIAEAIKGVANA